MAQKHELHKLTDRIKEINNRLKEIGGDHNKQNTHDEIITLIAERDDLVERKEAIIDYLENEN